MLVDDKLIKQIENFRKFARYVSGKFGVEIVFEAASAKADSNNVIYLPMMTNMTERDIQFQYGILLHELGHIKYSDYSGRHDNLLVSENHFLLCNAIEDARIENLLMNEYDGAIDYFHNLYYDFAHDIDYVKKVFGFTPKDTDFWYHLRIYVHDFLVNLRQKRSLESLYGKKNAEQLDKFIKTYKINEILKSKPVKTWTDVVQMSVPIYEAACKFSKDTSGKLKIAEAKETKSEVQKDLTNLKKALETLQEQIKKEKEIIKSLKDEVDETRRKREKEIVPLERELDSLKDIIAADKSRLKKHNKLMKKKINAMMPLSRKNNYQSQKEVLEKQLQDLRNQMDAIKAANTPNALKDIKKAMRKEKSILSKIATKEKRIGKAEADYRSKMNEISNEKSNLTTEQFEKISQRHNSNTSRWDEIVEELQNKKTETEAEKKFDNAKKSIKQNQEKMQEKLIDTLKKSQSSLEKQGMEMPNMPGFEKSEEWPDSDPVQQDFDQQASKETGDIINNGVSFDFGGDRAIMSFIDQSIDDVKSFNVLEHFANKLEDNKLDNFNEVVNTLETSEKSRTNVTKAKHIAVTEKFDKIDYKTNSNGSDLNIIRRDNAQVIKNLKNIFRTRLKFSKKDHFKGNHDEGSLDTRSLWKLATPSVDDGSYFEVNNPKFINKVAASIVADISGSHEKEYTDYGNKVKALMLFLSEALNEVFVKHEILGIHAPISSEMQELQASAIYNRRVNRLETVVYKRFEDKKNNGIDNMMIECTDNSDGESLKIAGKRLLKMQAKDRILFYITDGKPYLTDCNMDIIDQDLRNTVEWLKENKIKVFAFGFNDDGKKFFDNFCYIKNWNDLLNFAQKSL